MNFKSISYFLGLFCFPISFLSFINILYSSYFDYFLSIDSYFTTLFTSLIFGVGFLYYGKNSQKKIDFIEQLFLIIAVYSFTALLISIPFYFSNNQATFLRALFFFRLSFFSFVLSNTVFNFFFLFIKLK